MERPFGNGQYTSKRSGATTLDTRIAYFGKCARAGKEHKKRGAYAPFGIGTHLCLGAGAAEAQMVLVMAIFLHLVRPELANPGEKLAIKNDPAPTLGQKFRIRLVERRNGSAAD